MSLKEFEIIKDIGKGSFGLVLLVRRLLDNKIYALKRVKLSKMSNKEKINSLNEIRFLASISHQNIIAYKESFFEDNSDTLNLVLEYADDGDLQSKIFNQRKIKTYFKEKIIWSYFIQILKGLKTLHDNNVIHRDLKSANIFITKNGILKLGDLNISKLYKENYLNLNNSQMGTPCYAAPEIWNDKGYSFKSDIWSLGCILYEMCTLHLPFGERNIKDIYCKIMNGNFLPIPNHFSKDLNVIINLLLQVNPKKRPSCQEILDNCIVSKKIESLFGFFGVDRKRNNYSILSNNSLNSFRDNLDIKNLLPGFNKYEEKKMPIPICHKKIFSGYSTHQILQNNNNKSINNNLVYNQFRIRRNFSFQKNLDNSQYSNRENSIGVIRAKNISKIEFNDIDSSQESIHNGLLRINPNNIASDKKKKLMKHYSFQNGIGIGVGILSSINRENLSKKIINENKNVNNRTIENDISEKNKIYPIKNNVIYPPSSRNNLKHNTKNVINKNLNNEKIDLKKYSALSTTQNSTLSSYNNTNSNESKEYNDDITKKINIDFDKNMKNKSTLNILINKIAIPDFIENKQMNKSIFFHKQNIHNLINLNTIEN